MTKPVPGETWEKKAGFAGAGERVMIESVVAGEPARAWCRELPHGDLVSITVSNLQSRYVRVSP
jgi:hypothetical protein